MSPKTAYVSHHPPPNDLADGPKATLKSGFGLGQIAGVQLFVHWSIIVIFSLITLSLGASVFPRWHPEWPPALIWGTSLAAALCFFVSLLAHEMSHALVARRQGIAIHRITLFLFGGLAHMEGEPETPKAEFLVAVAGPLASIAIGLVSVVLGVWLAGFGSEAEIARDPVAAFRSIGPVATLLLWLGPINLALAVFNLVPGFPLDGGRILRAALWAATGDQVKASRWASHMGQAVAWGLILLGIVNVLQGAFLQGLWLALIGSFLNSAARASYQQLLFQRALGSLRVERVMRRGTEWVPAQTTIEALVGEHLFRSDQRAFPVMTDEGLVGLVSFSDVHRVPQTRWHTTRVAEIMTPAQDLISLPKNASAARALALLASHDINQLLVLDDGLVEGLVQRSDLLTWLALQTQ